MFYESNNYLIYTIRLHERTWNFKRRGKRDVVRPEKIWAGQIRSNYDLISDCSK